MDDEDENISTIEQNLDAFVRSIKPMLFWWPIEKTCCAKWIGVENEATFLRHHEQISQTISN